MCVGTEKSTKIFNIFPFENFQNNVNFIICLRLASQTSITDNKSRSLITNIIKSDNLGNKALASLTSLQHTKPLFSKLYNITCTFVSTLKNVQKHIYFSFLNCEKKSVALFS